MRGAGREKEGGLDEKEGREREKKRGRRGGEYHCFLKHFNIV